DNPRNTIFAFEIELTKFTPSSLRPLHVKSIRDFAYGDFAENAASDKADSYPKRSAVMSESFELPRRFLNSSAYVPSPIGYFIFGIAISARLEKSTGWASLVSEL